jgi:flagellar basal-body rod protein FlgC
MDFMSALDIGASGLSAERSNINIISMNLANAKTTRTPEGGAYRRKSVVFAEADVDKPFSDIMQDALGRQLKGVRVLGVATDSRPLKRVHEPGHPDANADGDVFYPDINVVEEMTNLMTATRTYEAGVSTINTVKSMYQRALTLGA